MADKETCPHCGQRLLVRFGVGLSPKLADIFDMASRNGVIEQMLWVLFPGKSKRDAANALRANVWLLNSRLAETEYQVRADRYGKYKLIKTKIKEVA